MEWIGIFRIRLLIQSALDLKFLQEYDGIYSLSLQQTYLIPARKLVNCEMHFGFLKQNIEQRRDLILNGSITRSILLLSVPTLMMGLIQSMLPVIDGLFVNNLVGTIAASAVTYSTPIVNMSVALHRA